jgi:hypothetical protein
LADGLKLLIDSLGNKFKTAWHAFKQAFDKVTKWLSEHALQMASLGLSVGFGLTNALTN